VVRKQQDVATHTLREYLFPGKNENSEQKDGIYCGKEG
jgi:hypothetical protein